MSAITVQSTIPAELVAISAEALDTRDQLLERSVVIRKGGAITTDTYQEAADTYKEITAFAKAVETQRETIKAPVIALGRQIDAAAKEGVQAIEQERQHLGALINAWEAKERDRVAEEQRLAREVARKAEQEERDRQEAALRARAELEAPPGEEPQPIDVAEILVRPVPVQKVETFKGVTRATPKKKVQILEQSKIPFTVNGIRLWKEPDLTSILTLLKAGIDVPGCVMVEETNIGARG